MNFIGYCFVSSTLIQLSFAGVLSESQRDGKVFAVVSFPHEECTVGMGNGAMISRGVCYSKKQCSSKGGIELGGSCAQGYGVCCSISQSCPTSGGNVIVKNNLTTLVGNSMQSCNFVIPKQPDVCQIRLDFLQFQLGKYEYGQPSDTPQGDPSVIANFGNCIRDKLAISPTQNLPEGITLCGTGTDQHLYLHYGDQEKITLSLTQMTMGSFQIKVTMIKCNSVLRAPQGCTQYHRTRNGKVESFNYPFMQLNNHRYSTCIHSTDGDRKVRWSPCMASPSISVSSTFFVSGVPPVRGRMGPEQCVTDYVLLPGTNSERYCGGNFTAIDQNRVTPFNLWVNFDEAETPKELTPGTMNDPMTGCPLGFTCSLPDNAPCTNDPDPEAAGTCSPPPGYAALMDNYNIGFCLEFAVGSV